MSFDNRRRKSARTLLMIEVSSTDRVFVLTGAGVSEESGIPTFRGVGGLWENHRVDEIATPAGWKKNPRLVWEFYSARRQAARKAKPNPAHIALAKFEKKLQGRLFVCTQNVDNLHEQAGSKNVVHMHGELFKNRCDSCDRLPFDDVGLYVGPTEVPRCECGGRIRPHICWFGEMPFELDKIFNALAKCTIFLAIGTSGKIYPAAGFVAKVAGRARTIYVGPVRPENAAFFAKRYKGKAGNVVPSLLCKPAA